MIRRSVAVTCVVAPLAGIASASNLVQIALESVRAGGEGAFGYFLLSSALLQVAVSILLLLYRNFVTSLMFLLISAVPASLEIAQPVPVRSFWDVVSTIAAGLGVLAVVLNAVRSLRTSYQTVDSIGAADRHQP